MENKFYVKDYLSDSLCDSEAIEKCFAAAEEAEGNKTIIFDGKDYLIDRAILVSSNTDIFVDNCTIKQNDYVFDNIFRGNNHVINGIDPYGRPIEVTHICNIRLMGLGEAKIVGTDKSKVGYHPFYKEYQKMVGDFWGWRTHMISFSNGDYIEVSGLKLSQTMGWSVCFDNCQQCHVHHLDIHSNVKNGDGINFRSGCNHCIVENITGYTSDDTVACTALSRGKREKEFSRYLSYSEPYNCSHENIDGNIHHIRIKNIHTGGREHGIICLAAFGNQVHDIEIIDIKEIGEVSREATVKVYTGYGTDYNAGDIHNIKIRDVVCEKSQYALLIACDAENLTYENIVQNNPDGEAVYKK